MLLKEVLKTVDNDYPEMEWEKALGYKPQLTASFVIPAYRCKHTILAVLSGIESQYLKANIKEVVVVEDGETDGTDEVVGEFQKKTGVKIVYLRNEPRRCVAYTRNRGFRAAKGDIVAFLDCDIVIPPDYLNYHLYLHSEVSNAIGVSLRSFTDEIHDSAGKYKFPITEIKGEWRVSRFIKAEYCTTEASKRFADTTVRLIEEMDGFKGLGNGYQHYYQLPNVCMTCAITYRRKDLIKVRGCPSNFLGWGYDDTAMAAKVISLGRYVVPIMKAGVYHIKHPDRSDDKKTERVTNRYLYEKMLSLEQNTTFHYYLRELENK